MKKASKWRLSVCSVLAILCSQSAVLAHAPVLLLKSNISFHHANNAFANVPVSGSSRAFASTIKTLVGTTIKNTVLHAPLNNISGQFTGIDFYSTTSAGGTGFYYRDPPNIIQFGSSNPFSTSQPGSQNFGLVNSITGLPGAVSFLPLGHPVSGAQRALFNYYGTAAASGYNAGINILQHPTGGLLFGTAYYGPPYGNSYPAFEAFGNNPYVAMANSPSFSSLTLTQPLQSYIQFGKFIRPITSGLVTGTYYGPTSYSPPYSQPAPGPYISFYKPFALSIGKDPFNTLLYAPISGNPYSGLSYFK
jgi:hypothetical protein